MTYPYPAKISQISCRATQQQRKAPLHRAPVGQGHWSPRLAIARFVYRRCSPTRRPLFYPPAICLVAIDPYIGLRSLCPEEKSTSKAPQGSRQLLLFGHSDLGKRLRDCRRSSLRDHHEPTKAAAAGAERDRATARVRRISVVISCCSRLSSVPCHARRTRCRAAVSVTAVVITADGHPPPPPADKFRA